MKIKPNHISLNSREDSQNITFMRELYAEDKLEGVRKWFDKKEPNSFRREIDETMTLQKFSELIRKPYHAVLQIRWHQREEIKYGMIVTDARTERIDRFLFIECPFDFRNYFIVDIMFRRAYGQSIESIPNPFEK